MAFILERKIIEPTRVTAATVLLALVIVPSLARAADPKFEYGKPEEVKAVEWKAQARGGIISSTGNAQQITGSAAFSVSRKEAANKLALDGSIAYARSQILSVNDANMDKIVEEGEVFRDRKVTSNSASLKARYDRFFTTNNAGYVSVQMLRDVPAGKRFAGGGQAGYSRQLFKNDHNLALAEIGYDFSYESYVSAPDAVAIHSLRLFAGDVVTITKETGVWANVEWLANLNTETAPGPGYPKPGPFEDSRITGKAGLTTALWKDISFGFTFTLKFDNAPAPLAKIGGLPFAPDYHPLVEKLDTVTEASLIVTFL